VTLDAKLFMTYITKCYRLEDCDFKWIYHSVTTFFINATSSYNYKIYWYWGFYLTYHYHRVFF